MICKTVELSAMTTIKIGGTVKNFFICEDVKDLTSLITAYKHYNILGNGSNLLVSDNGIENPVIKLGGGFKHISHTGNLLEAGAGVSVRNLINYCIINNLGGLSFLAGIPATVGGCTFMNASANGMSISDVLTEVETVTAAGIKTIKAKDIKFSYRGTSLTEGIIVKVRFSVLNGRDIKKDINSILTGRIQKQEMLLPSCGCIFKNPGDSFAGRLIDEAGLKGLKKNDAQVSNRHGNFIVNLGKAGYNDVDYLIKFVRDKVYSRSGVLLQEEIVRWA
ncbi:MAG: UDP-N-acetylmuramate dehydrogenase [Candidatus Omnitrophica bacterium]|nr:UDP-N-acetylmuramate dehydrogenase [Candidatus Omnitrophota bacterium]